MQENIITDITHAPTCCNCRAQSDPVQKADTRLILLDKTLPSHFHQLFGMQVLTQTFITALHRREFHSWSQEPHASVAQYSHLSFKNSKRELEVH